MGIHLIGPIHGQVRWGLVIRGEGNSQLGSDLGGPSEVGTPVGRMPSRTIRPSHAENSTRLNRSKHHPILHFLGSTLAGRLLHVFNICHPESPLGLVA